MYNVNIVTDLSNALPGNSSVNTVKHATREEAVFSLDSTEEPIDWLDGNHVIYVYCTSRSIPRLYKSVGGGGGVEYLHRNTASRRRRRNGSLESETAKYDRESHGTRTRE
jgi:hypothetical protein